MRCLAGPALVLLAVLCLAHVPSAPSMTPASSSSPRTYPALGWTLRGGGGGGGGESVAGVHWKNSGKIRHTTSARRGVMMLRGLSPGWNGEDVALPGIVTLGLRGGGDEEEGDGGGGDSGGVGGVGGGAGGGGGGENPRGEPGQDWDINDDGLAGYRIDEDLDVGERPEWTEADRAEVIKCIDTPKFPDAPPPNLWDDAMPELEEAGGGGVDYMDLLQHPLYKGKVELCEEEEEEESEGTLQRRVWQRELWAAAVEGDVETVRDRIVDKKVDVNTRCTEEYVDIMACNWRGINRTALHFACLSDEEYEGNQEVISLLIKLGADLAAQTDEGDTPLHYACLYGNADVCIMLAVAGADPTAKNYDMPMDPSDIGIFLRQLEYDTMRNPPKEDPNDPNNFSPASTPLELSIMAGKFSTQRTRQVMCLILELWEKEGKVSKDLLMPMVAAGDLRREEGRRNFDEKYGATEEAFTLNMNGPGDPPGHIPGFDEAAWEKIQRLHHYNITEALQEAQERRLRWERIDNASKTFVPGSLPPNKYMPWGEPYPEWVPMGEREWAYFSSGLWTHPDFRGEIIYDDVEATNWPMKHHWAKTPDYPDGLWQAFDPDLTLNLTDDERKKCKETDAMRVAQEEAFSRDKTVKQGDKAWRAMAERRYPPSRTEREKGFTSCDYPDPVGDEAKGMSEGDERYARPWSTMAQVERARETARLDTLQAEIDKRAKDMQQDPGWWETISPEDRDKVNLRPMKVDADCNIREVDMDNPDGWRPVEWDWEPEDDHDPNCEGDDMNDETTKEEEQALMF